MLSVPLPLLYGLSTALSRDRVRPVVGTGPAGREVDVGNCLPDPAEGEEAGSPVSPVRPLSVPSSALLAMPCLFKAASETAPCIHLGLVTDSSLSPEAAPLWGTGELRVAVKVTGDPLTDPLPAMTVTGDPLLEEPDPACVMVGEAERARCS